MHGFAALQITLLINQKEQKCFVAQQHFTQLCAGFNIMHITRRVYLKEAAGAKAKQTMENL